ncbi:MAG TPA: glycosyltransferase, partial [Actinomycetota bacterium]|nr:glycosyltransferase [Actinomycetota bacterium]
MEGLRLAILSLHTSPGDQPGSGDAGGMNVYVRNVASELVARGAIVDVYTRCAGREVPEIELVGPGLRVIQAQAGPCARVDKDDLDELLPRFVLSILRHEPPPYDLIHSHYWLSGRAGLALRERWDAPLVASFHTLAAVKEADGFAEPEARFRGERAVVAGADRL